jgi:RNA polymerase sigma-70 factor (ECF subfamily)
MVISLEGAVLSLGPDFASILSAARQGADWAWTKIYREYAPHVLRYLRAHSAPDPDDLLGEVFLQVVRNLKAFTGSEDDFRAWMFTIVHRRLVDDWRRKGRRREEPYPHEALSSHAAPEDIEAHALRGLDNERVRSLVDCLTPEQREVLFLRVMAGLSIDQTCAVLDKSLASVKSLQVRALETLRRNLPADTESF